MRSIQRSLTQAFLYRIHLSSSYCNETFLQNWSSRTYTLCRQEVLFTKGPWITTICRSWKNYKTVRTSDEIVTDLKSGLQDVSSAYKDKDSKVSGETKQLNESGQRWYCFGPNSNYARGIDRQSDHESILQGFLKKRMLPKITTKKGKSIHGKLPPNLV